MRSLLGVGACIGIRSKQALNWSGGKDEYGAVDRSEADDTNSPSIAGHSTTRMPRVPKHSFERKVNELNKQIRTQHAEERRDALAALAAMASFKIEDQGALDALRQSGDACLELIETSDDGKTVQNCALVLGGLFKLGTLQTDVRSSQRYANALVCALAEDGHDGETKAAIVNAIVDFSETCESNRRNVVDRGVVTLVVNASNGIEDIQLLYSFGNALINLSMDIAECTDELVEAGGLNVYLKLISSQQSTARQVGLLGIGMAIGKDVSYALNFINISGAVSHITACMQSVDADEKSIASDIFFTLGGTPECKDALLAALQSKMD